MPFPRGTGHKGAEIAACPSASPCEDVEAMTAMRSSLSLLQTWYSISTKSHIVDRTAETFLLQGVCTYFSRHHALKLYTLLSACLLVVCNLLKASESKLYPCDCRSRVEFFPPLKSVQNLSLFNFLSGSRNMQGRLQPTLFLLHQTCPPESQLSVKTSLCICFLYRESYIRNESVQFNTLADISILILYILLASKV